MSESTEPTFAVGDKVIINSVGGFVYDPETGEQVEDNRPTGVIADGPFGHEIPDIIQNGYSYSVELDDADLYPISPVTFAVESLELIEGQPKNAGKKASAGK